MDLKGTGWVETRLNWIRIVNSGDSFEYGNKNSGPTKMENFLELMKNSGYSKPIMLLELR